MPEDLPSTPTRCGFSVPLHESTGSDYIMGNLTAEKADEEQMQMAIQDFLFADYKIHVFLSTRKTH